MVEEPKRRSGDVVRRVLGYLVAAACLVWVFHGIHGEKLLGQLRSIRWEWVTIAAVVDVLSYVCQGVRWRFLLRPSGEVSVLRATQAIYVGLLTNEVVPLRAGELVRAYLVSRWQGTTMLSVIPSIAIERLFDGIWLAVGIGLAAIFVRLPENLLRAADIFGGAVLIAAALFIYLVVRKEKIREDRPPARDRLWSPLRRLASLIGSVAEGIKKIGVSRYFYLSFFASSLIIVCQITAFWLVMKAYGLDLSLWVGAAVFIIMYFGTALPNAPSNVGTYQFFTVLGLTIFGIDKTTATGFSVAVFVVLTATLWIVGLAALAGTGMRFTDIRREIGELVSRR